MALLKHPGLGAIIVCDFDQGFREPEMVKRRLCVAVSPQISVRAGLCTVVPLSTTPPTIPMPYHCTLSITPSLPEPWNADEHWVKGDMICAVGLHRMDFIREGKTRNGERIYNKTILGKDDLRRIQECMLCSLGLAGLKKHLKPAI